MKRIFIAACLLTAATTMFAQTSDKSSYTPTTHSSRSTTRSVSHDFKFEGTEMSYADGHISFSNLPEVTKQPWAIITDENGEVVTQSRVNSESSMDVHKLSKGMYFVSLVYKNKTEKAFVLQVE